MKTNYENWMPKSMIKYLKYGFYFTLGLFLILAAYIFYRKANGQMYLHWLSLIDTLLLMLSLSLSYFAKRFKAMRAAFDFGNPEAISWKIINYTADQMLLNENAKILDVGCGSGALSIAVAKRNPQSQIVGIDKWDAVYKDFSQKLCEQNAKAEGISNVSFQSGNAIKLDFEDESFDGLVSNYVYHNIPGNRQDYLLESLRTLKKGGKFAIHDIFSKSKYGDLDGFIAKLKDDGYQEVKLIDSTNGTVLSQAQTQKYMLRGSKLLVGIK